MNFFLTFEYEKLQRHIKTSKGQFKEEKGNISTYSKVIFHRYSGTREPSTAGLWICEKQGHCTFVYTAIDLLELSCNK